MNGHAKDVLFEGQYTKAKAKGECPNTKAAVLIDGKDAGSIFYLCLTEKCDVHNRVTRYQPTPQQKAQRKKEALAERVEKLSRVRILEGIRKKLPDVLSRPDLEMVALDYFRRLGHDNHRRLSKLYAWEEKKSKTSWGAQTVDYEKIATGVVQKMTAADVHRFLVVCALVSDSGASWATVSMSFQREQKNKLKEMGNGASQVNSTPPPRSKYLSKWRLILAAAAAAQLIAAGRSPLVSARE